jgi:hypothetical protein
MLLLHCYKPYLVFFRLKRSFIIADKKLHIEISAAGYPLNKFPSDHGKKITKYAGVGRVQTIKKFSSQNLLVKLVFPDK